MNTDFSFIENDVSTTAAAADSGWWIKLIDRTFPEGHANRIRKFTARIFADFIASLVGLSGSTTLTTLLGGLVSSQQSLSGAGAVNLTTLTTNLTTTGANALTLANGTSGQIKIIRMVVDNGDGTLTPTTKTGFSTITFNDVGDTVILQYVTTLGWMIVSNNGTTVA
jgi:hypothetical protein